MKQPIEEAEKEYYEKNYQGVDINRMLVENAFEAGAEWQSNQSPWISVKEKAGCDSSNDCIVMDSDGEVFRACFIRNKWLKYNRGYYVIDNVTHWMPIPSFDEILIMNREIIFRGKRVIGGEWVNSMTISHGTIKRKTYAVFFEIEPEKWIGVIPETVGQFISISKRSYCEF